MFEKTVDKVVGALNKAITDLSEVKTAQENLSSSLQDQITQLNSDRIAAQEEANRAARISERLQELLA